MNSYQYSRWDGRQSLPEFEPDRLLAELEYHLTLIGDIVQSVWKIQRDGLRTETGDRVSGNRHLYQLLAQKKSELIAGFEKTGGQPSSSDYDSVLSRSSVLTSPDARAAALLANIAALESQLERNQRQHTLSNLDLALVEELLGEDEAALIERLSRMETSLADAGYLRLSREKYVLTPQAIRKIGEKALAEILAEIKRAGPGRRRRYDGGIGGTTLDETKRYESDDDFHIHLTKTIMNSIFRQPGAPPLKLTPADFEIIKTENETRTATVLMLDMSRSMLRRDNFQAAKKVALALHELIRTRYPTNDLYLVGFSTYATRLKPADLPYLYWGEKNPDTNLQQGLGLARKLLEHNAAAGKEIILITDGEPTAHMENGQVFAKYPPSETTRRLTLAELRNCSKAGITVNVFLFEGGNYTQDFLRGVARINRGRVFFTGSRTLGAYLLTDYSTGKTRTIC